ncbi:hypothetical protein [Kaistia sp. MMO-174]|uniref:hypothetical protein n=1 Tax=Kaistia sp. MMO-174 TaxID=3081256 RepID=UPI00301662AB
MAKTVQALKIAASWTPNQPTAGVMINAVLAETDAFGARFSSGRLLLKHAIKIDFTDPSQAQRVSARAADIKAGLASTGTLHDFRTTAGAVHADEAEVLPEPVVEPSADMPSELPEGFTIRDSDGALIIPDAADEARPSGPVALYARFDRIETVSGKVLKTKEGPAPGGEAAAVSPPASSGKAVRKARAAG